MENTKESKITTPMAIIVAGFLVMVAILITNNGGSSTVKEKTLSEQVGVNKEEFTQCMEDTDINALLQKTALEAENTMKNIPATERGTPYIVLMGKDGVKIELRGNIPYDDYYSSEESQKSGIKDKGVKSIINDMLAGTAQSNYEGEITSPNNEDHIIGNIDAPIVMIEYSDLECPYCKKFGETAKRIVEESNGQVAWIYRHWIVHSSEQYKQQAHIKAAASECVAKLKDNDAFWKYIDLVFGLMDPVVETPASEQL